MLLHILPLRVPCSGGPSKYVQAKQMCIKIKPSKCKVKEIMKNK